MEAAALADLVIEKHMQLRKVQLNLVKSEVTKNNRRAASEAKEAAMKGNQGRWTPNKARYRGKSLGFMSVEHPIRWGAIYICCHGLDEAALIFIFINTVCVSVCTCARVRM